MKAEAISALAAVASAIATFLAWLAASSSAATQKVEQAARSAAWKQRADGLTISLRYEVEFAALCGFRAVVALSRDMSNIGVRKALSEILSVRTPILELVALDTSVVEKDVGKGVLLAHTDLNRARSIFSRFTGAYDADGIPELLQQLDELAESLNTAYKQFSAYAGQADAKDLRQIAEGN